MEVFDVPILVLVKCLEGYALLNEPDEKEIMDKVVEAMQGRPDKRYIKHVIWKDFVPDGGMEKRTVPYASLHADTIQVATGTLRIIARIYVEDR